MAHAPLEELVSSKHFFGLTTASPVQRAFCRAVDGVPLADLADDPIVMQAFGGARPPESRPLEATWISAIRVAKSLIAAACCIRWSQTVDIGSLGPGETPRVAVLSLDKDKAGVVASHLVGRISSSPLLKMLLIKKDQSAVTEESRDDIILRHPSGRAIGVKVVAGKRAGGAAVSRWLAGLISDEFPRMNGANDGIVNWDDTRNAAMDRILPGGQILNIGSPWAPSGPAFDMVSAHFGKPTEDLVVMWSTAWDTNPLWWTPERVERARKRNPNFQTDVAARFATAEESFFSADRVDGALRKGSLELAPEQGASYSAFIDPATRKNAFTLIIVTRRGPRMVVASAREWIGSRDAPLDTGTVLRDIARACAFYGVDCAATDQYMADALISQARSMRDEAGSSMPAFALHVWSLSEEEKARAALHFEVKLNSGEIELANVTTWRGGETETTRSLVVDVQRVKKQVTQTGISVKLPKTPDGRHADFWPPIGMAMRSYLADVRPAEKAVLEEVRIMREQTMRRFGPSKDEDYDD